MKNDVKLILMLRENPSAAFKKVYYQYANLVYYQAYNILNNKEDAEDVLQNTFIKFMRNIDSIADDSNIKQLLSKISKNEAIDLYRKKANRKEVYNESILDNLKSNDDTSTFKVIQTLNNVLDEEEAHILTLKIVYDYSFKEIADDTNLSIGAIEAKYYKAIKELKKYYEGSE